MTCARFMPRFDLAGVTRKAGLRVCVRVWGRAEASKWRRLCGGRRVVGFQGGRRLAVGAAGGVVFRGRARGGVMGGQCTGHDGWALDGEGGVGFGHDGL